ncbi:MAG TPA: patatin-like phospholipase family protein [Thermoanaerobaculia bacterium]|nr:patatin-like phospholipase family protein [Thermoanaerobaculia bacterium]
MPTEETPSARPSPPQEGHDLALVLTGGGARAAYQVGVLRTVWHNFPDAAPQVITGVSAGAINAAFLAAHPGDSRDAAQDLRDLWLDIGPEDVFQIGTGTLTSNFLRWGVRLLSGGSAKAPQVRSLLDTTPLRAFLERALSAVDGEIAGISNNLEKGRLKAFALSGLNYGTGQTVTWVQGCEISTWERPHRVSLKTRMTVDHVLASSSLPILFPAVNIQGNWYGDGGIRQSAPLSPPIHLGANRIIAVSTRYARSGGEAALPVISGYPPPAQILGTMLNAVFLDMIDQDALRLTRFNALLNELPEERRGGMRPIDLLVLRPSRDLGRLAAEYESKLPRTFRFLTRGLGTRETASPDLLSLLMFQSDYLAELIRVGERDTEARLDEIERLVTGAGGQ